MLKVYAYTVENLRIEMCNAIYTMLKVYAYTVENLRIDR